MEVRAGKKVAKKIKNGQRSVAKKILTVVACWLK
jgi:hypothetical protein